MNSELEFWQGEGGASYLRRNEATEAEVNARSKALHHPIYHVGATLPPFTWKSELRLESGTILEVGAGPGANLLALKRVCPKARLFAIEPNPVARKHLEGLGVAEVYDGHAGAICAADSSFDLVFTAGVLIHIHPDRLVDCMREIVRVSKRFVLAIEYFAPTCEPVLYYGAERIWRNDFGRLYTEKCGLKFVDSGFFWRAPGEAGYDNTVWWLGEKQ